MINEIKKEIESHIGHIGVLVISRSDSSTIIFITCSRIEFKQHSCTQNENIIMYLLNILCDNKVNNAILHVISFS